MSDLKPCPFCGGEADSDMDCEYGSPCGWSVTCELCGLTVYKESKALAEAAWNTRTSQWNPDMEAAPYETPVLTLWAGNKQLKPVVLVNIKNNGLNLGKRDSWWRSKPSEMPTKWMPLPEGE